MAGNNSIQVLRGSRNAISQSSQQLLDGQLLYNTTDNYLTVGGGSSNDVSKLPIVCREIRGYAEDTYENKISANENKTEYKINYVDGKGLSFQNNVKYTGDSIKFSDGSLGTQKGDAISSAAATGIQSIAFGGTRWDYINAAENNFGRTPTSAEGNQSFAAGGSSHTYGDWSSAIGKDVNAYQKASFASGGGTQAGMTAEQFQTYYGNKDNKGATYTQSYSFAASFGEANKALGRATFSAGTSNTVVGDYSVAIGNTNSIGKNDDCVTLGRGNVIKGSGNKCVSLGRNNVINNSDDIYSIGAQQSVSTSSNSILIGNKLNSSSRDQFIFGFNNKNNPDNLLEFGTGYYSSKTLVSKSSSAGNKFTKFTILPYNPSISATIRVYSLQINQENIAIKDIPSFLSNESLYCEYTVVGNDYVQFTSVWKNSGGMQLYKSDYFTSIEIEVECEQPANGQQYDQFGAYFGTEADYDSNYLMTIPNFLQNFDKEENRFNSIEVTKNLDINLNGNVNVSKQLNVSDKLNVLSSAVFNKDSTFEEETSFNGNVNTNSTLIGKEGSFESLQCTQSPQSGDDVVRKEDIQNIYYYNNIQVQSTSPSASIYGDWFVTNEVEVIDSYDNTTYSVTDVEVDNISATVTTMKTGFYQNNKTIDCRCDITLVVKFQKNQYSETFTGYFKGHYYGDGIKLITDGGFVETTSSLLWLKGSSIKISNNTIKANGQRLKAIGPVIKL